MKKLVCLIDPSWDYHKLVKTVNKNWESLKSNVEVWVGCVWDNGVMTHDVLDSLKIPKENKFLFPGTIGQGVRAGGEVTAVFVPKVLGRGFSLKRMILNLAVKVGERLMRILYPKTKLIPYLYLVLSKESRIGEKVDANRIRDAEALKLIKENLNGCHHIYIEGGSNAKHSVAERAGLLREIKKQFNLPLYAGGGIRSANEFTAVAKVADKIIVGHYFGENPESVLEFSKILQKN
ncbi:MAG: geranylgeranylglyceryl/heptaprenylglyceryl phosphate synthase [Candidatus Nanoarchaeia archaeon]|nr:geranylgeranylglyceryl/heptaprenylglyceryl phosphate synthase [Candidatus Nanoarchaeia archaeon]MDD5239844.1 geranylgeranylglyceryl/heptaprenylglyceryl phosphate synthase [Candidatus Nanoarchaeia archaeon]